jgi:UDP-N-acetylglucosamine 2-epimerase (non-hydrolysing)
MKPDQSLPELTASLMTGIDRILESEAPALVLAQGDTTSVLHYRPRRVLPAHPVRARRGGPANSQALLSLSGGDQSGARRPPDAYHFAPTERAAANLRAEGIDGASIFITGNTVIDALYASLEAARLKPFPLNEGERLVLMTAHRRENFGAPFP